MSCLNETFLSEFYIKTVINVYFPADFCTQTLYFIYWVASDNFFNKRTCLYVSYVSNCIRPKRLLYDAGRDLLAIVNFLVLNVLLPAGLCVAQPCRYCFYSTRGQSNLTKSASRGAHSPVMGHPRGSKVVPLNSWGRVSY